MKWKPEEIKTLKKMRNTGASATQIAKVLKGRNASQIANYCQKNSIPLKEKAPKIPETQVPVEVEKAKVLPRPKFGHLALDVIFDPKGWIDIGLVADTHLCCVQQCLSELHAHYDLMASQGITTVFHAGNIVDGHIPKINGDSLYCTSVDAQAQYVIDNYPARPGMTTYFITGDDHEGWWQKEGFNFGAYLQMLAHEQGRKDLVYIGHVEADVELWAPEAKRPTIIKVQHPGGGSAYARSYKGQKQVEAFEGGEKPSILIQGHYHVSNYMNDRNIHVVNMPGFQAQTIFARKKNLRMEVGGAIASYQVNKEDGSVTQFRPWFNRFFTRGYYKAFLSSDKKILKGHLVLRHNQTNEQNKS